MAYKIISRCVCCHSCVMECPAEAIKFVGSQYAIDPEKCTSCGLCADVCPISVIADENAPAAKPPKHELEHISCDLLVLGAGGSGLIAAVKAAEVSGRKVIVLEKAKKAGGSTTLAHGFFVNNCQWHKDAGYPDSTNQVIERSIKDAEGHLPRSLVEKIVRSSGEFFDWLCEKGEAEKYFTIGRGPLGVFGINYPNRSFENLKCRDQSIGPGWAGTYIIRKMMQMCEKLGIQVLTEHKGKELITDDKGKIVGVTADNPGGQVKIDCKACILATGGFSGDDEKLKKFEPGFFDGGIPVHRFSPPSCSGDGMDLAAQVGGRIDLSKTKLNKFGPAHHPFTHSVNRISGIGSAMFTLSGNYLEGPIVMRMGDTSLMDSIPEHAVWYVMDSKAVEDAAQFFVKNPPDGNEQWIFETYMDDIEFELKCDRPAKKGFTLEELARNMGVDPVKFAEEVGKYNRISIEEKDKPKETHPMADAFKMPPIEKKPIIHPPFYAFFGQRFCEGAFGGVLTNDNIEVIKKNGNVIPGLYATGDAAGTWYTRGILGPLTELTWAVTSGYIAGRNAGEYISK